MSNIWSVIQDIFNTLQSDPTKEQSPLDDESDSEDGWRAAFYQAANPNCVYIDYNKTFNPDAWMGSSRNALV